MSNPELRHSPVTLRDLAQALGVSHMTVSRALRQSPKVNKLLCEKILRTAEEMGYHRNPAAAALTHLRGATSAKSVNAAIAWLNFWPEPKKLRSVPLFNETWKGVFESASALGYHIDEFICDGSLPPQRLKRILVARGIQGILLPPQRPPVRREDYDFDWSGFAAVRIGHTVSYPPVHMVSYSQASDTVEALRNIREKGYGKIGFVTTSTIQAYGLFDAGYMKIRSTWQRKDQFPVLVLDDWPKPEPHVLERLDKWMKKYKPDAILSTEYVKTLLVAAGYRVPEDVGVAATSVNNSDVDAGMCECPMEVGRVAVVNLIGLLHRCELGIPQYRHDILVRSVWCNGKSLPDRR